MTNKTWNVAGLSLVLALLAGNAAATRISNGQEKSDDVLYRIRAGDCAGAVGRLNEGLAKKYPEVYLLAATMFDNGVCVKPDWNKAVHFYVLANDAGEKAAAYRLAAGYAAPEHGSDVAAALWWASRPQVGIQSSNCGVPEDARDDPDRFVAALKTWSPQHLAACNYLVGVMSTLGAEIRYPDKAMSYQLGGDFTLRFLPAVPRIDIKSGETTEYEIGGVVSGDTLRDRKAPSAHRTFDDELNQVAQRALKRYPQPKGIDPASSSEMRFTFTIRD